MIEPEACRCFNGREESSSPAVFRFPLNFDAKSDTLGSDRYSTGILSDNESGPSRDSCDFPPKSRLNSAKTSVTLDRDCRSSLDTLLRIFNDDLTNLQIYSKVEESQRNSSRLFCFFPIHFKTEFPSLTSTLHLYYCKYTQDVPQLVYRRLQEA